MTRKPRDHHTTFGGFGTLLVIGHEWNPDEQGRRSMELLATEVVPRPGDLELAAK